MNDSDRIDDENRRLILDQEKLHFMRTFDGRWLYWPVALESYAANFLRIIADELDRRNAAEEGDCS